jgi:hypothetical protein
MKKLMYLFAIAVMSFFAVSCEEEEIEPVEEEFTHSHYQLTVFAEDGITYCTFTVHCDPPNENLTSRAMVKRNGKFEFYFGLLLDDYGGQLIKVSITSTNTSVSPYEWYEDYQIVEVEGNDKDNRHQIIFEVGD